MIVKSDLSRTFANLRNAHSFLIGTDRVTRRNASSDFSNISLGLTLWCGILSDCSNFSLEVLSGEPDELLSAKSINGRIKSSIKTIEGLREREVNITPFLSALDDLADYQLGWMSSDSRFKDESGHCIFLASIKEWKERSLSYETYESRLLGNSVLSHTEWAYDPFRRLLHNAGDLLILLLHKDLQQDERCIMTMTWCRQLASFLKKLVVDRPSLKEETILASVEMESTLRGFVSRLDNDEETGNQYYRNVEDMHEILQNSQLNDTWAEIIGVVPCHGKGAVSEKGVRDWYSKYQKMRPDPRAAYLLRHSDLGLESDYSPLIKEGDPTCERISRFIPVAKNWKKMRGISAEPIELQFWQQGVMHSLDRAMRRNMFWRTRVDIHDQTYSQKLCLSGSATGLYATVDLSSASDSVTVKLVHDIFGNSELCRWLLGTRSVSTDYDGNIIRLTKFAPMGSAVCFPVECIVFALAAEVAVARTRRSSSKRSAIRVYGDDIILPSYAYDELVAILTSLGFTVNTEKSFNKGNFRESCGAEGWFGVDINPIRYKSLPVKGSSSLISPDTAAGCVHMANALFERGCHVTRWFLLELLFTTYFEVGGSRTSISGKRVKPVRYPSSLAVFATFDGSHSTMSSSTPTNFHLRRKYSSDLQTIVYQVLVWKKKSQRQTEKQECVEESDLSRIDACRLVEWLIRNSEKRCVLDQPVSYSCIARLDEDGPTKDPIWGEPDRFSGLYSEAGYGFNPKTGLVLLNQFIDRPDGAGCHLGGLSMETKQLIVRCGYAILRSYVDEWKLMDEGVHLAFVKAKQSFAGLESERKLSPDPEMVPTVKWVPKDQLAPLALL